MKLPELRYLNFVLRVYLAGKPQLARDAFPHRLPILDRPFVSIICANHLLPSVRPSVRPSVTMHKRPSVCVPWCRSSFSLEYTSSPKVVCWSVCTAITLFYPPSVLPRGSLLDFLVCLYVTDGLSGGLTDALSQILSSKLAITNLEYASLRAVFTYGFSGQTCRALFVRWYAQSGHSNPTKCKMVRVPCNFI